MFLILQAAQGQLLSMCTSKYKKDEDSQQSPKHGTLISPLPDKLPLPKVPAQYRKANMQDTFCVHSFTCI